jgi:hypothetical protein
MKLINENIYWHETGKISNVLNILHGALGHAPTINLAIFPSSSKYLSAV